MTFPLFARRSSAPRSIDKGRRDFLGWLAMGTAASVVGCAVSSEGDAYGGAYGSDGEEPLGVDEAAQTACRRTTRDAKGPYFEAGAPVRPALIAGLEEPGVRLLLEGRMTGPDCKTPLPSYTLDIWQADARGNYYRAGQSDYRLRGKIKTDADGRYRFETILPGRYSDAVGMRPAHIHVSFLTPGGNVLLTSQLYFEGDPYLGPADYCTAAGTCNSADPDRQLRLEDTRIGRRAAKRSTFDAVMPRT